MTFNNFVSYIYDFARQGPLDLLQYVLLQCLQLW